jgi:mannosyl-oligosaccharide glucosidase
VDLESISVGKAAVGNLLGGIGYFYGQSKIALSRTLNVRFYYNGIVLIEEYATL